MNSALKAGSITAVAGTASYLAILVTLITFASTGVEAAELRSVLVPVTLLCSGVSLVFSVPSQIVGARGSRFPGAATVRGWGAWAAVVGAAFVGLFLVFLLVLFTVGRGSFLGALPRPTTAASFLSFMALGYLPLAVSDFIEGYLRGSGRFAQASGFVVIRAVVISVPYGIAVTIGGIDALSLPAFYALGGAATVVLAIGYVFKHPRPPGAMTSDSPPTRRVVIRVGLPLLGSYILLSTVVSLQIAGVQLGLGLTAQIAFSGILLIGNCLNEL